MTDRTFYPPFIKSGERSRVVMIDAAIALLPSFIWSVYIFGARAAMLCAVGVLAAVACELAYSAFTGKKKLTFDFSPVVTGLLISFGLPVTVPLWLPALLSAFAVIVVKRLCGGIGRNLFNPAAAALCLAYTVFPSVMEKYTRPFAYFGWYLIRPTEASIASERIFTSLDKLSAGNVDLENLWNSFYGIAAGPIGCISVLTAILGFAYLALRKTIRPAPPLLFVVTLFILTFFFSNGDSEPVYFALMHIFTGGVFMAAVFMCSDYTTTPYTKMGGAVFAVGAALLTMLLRYGGTYGASVYFAVLIMNALTPVIEKYTLTMPFGRAGYSPNTSKTKKKTRKKAGDAR